VSFVVAAVATGHVTIVYLAVVGFVQGLAGGLAGGAQFAALRRVVPAELLPAAFAQFEGRDMAIRLTGPSAGGFLFGVARWVPFLGDALSFLAGALGVALIGRPLGPDPGEREPSGSVFASIGTGLRFIRGNAYLRFLTAWIALANACATGLLLLVIVLVHSRHGSSALVGAVTSLGAIGGLAGAILSGRIARHASGRLLVIVVSWTVAAVAAGIAVVPSAWMIAALLALMFFLIAPLNVVFSSYEAQMIPDRLMGSVSSAISFAAASIKWLGALGAGLLASASSPMTATLLLAGVLAAIAVSTHFATSLHALNHPVNETPAG
jgi:hypothetical protein